jgi:chromatin remodeling complex protein RSC6
MPKSTKSETSQKTETKQETSKVKKAVEQTVEPSAEKKVKAKKTKAAVAPVENVVISSTPSGAAAVPAVSTPAVEASSASAAPTVAATETKLSAMFTEFFDKLHKAVSTFSTLKSEFKLLEKYANKELRALQKSHKKKGGNSGNRSPSGFVKPTLISNELASFLGKASGSEMARTEVTREINMYIRANSLQDKSNGRQINADDKLSTLLKLKEGDVLTYFNLQKFMSPHFAKVQKAQPVSASS